MKKSVIFLFLCIVAVGAIKNRSFHQNKVGSLLLYNVEALASDDEYMRPVQCVGIGSLDCPFSHEKVKNYFIGYSLGEQY